MHSVLVNAGADPSIEDNMQHTSQYYNDHSDEINIPEWQPKWTLPQPIPVSPIMRYNYLLTDTFDLESILIEL